MSLQPYTVRKFGGLVVGIDPEEVGPEQAIDLLNVDFDKPGIIRTRDGLVQYDTSGSTSDSYYRLVPDYAASTQELLAIRTTVVASNAQLYVDRLSGSGTVLSNLGNWDTISGTGAPVLTAASSVGTPLVPRLFLASHNGATTLRKLQTGVISATTGSPAYCCATPWQDGRLCQGWYLAAADSPTGANGSQSTVFFSDAGGPETYTAANNAFVHLAPGDGEEITGMAAYGNYLIVSKNTQLFVFYGTSVDSGGLPIFNSRRVSIPARLANTGAHGDPQWNALVSGDDGVYFVTSRGVFRTQGDTPVLISSAMTPIFDGTADASIAWNQTAKMSLNLSRNRLFVTYQTASAVRTLVYDMRRDFWTLWGFPATASSIVPYSTGATAIEGTFFSQGNHVYKIDSTATDDYGTAITSRYQSGFYEPVADAEVFTRWTRLTGTGTPTVDLYTDFATSDPLTRGAAVTLGTAPTPAEGFHQQSYQGRKFSHRISATSGAWTLNDLRHDIAHSRFP